MEALVERATEADLWVALARRPGDHVIAGTVIATIWPQAMLKQEHDACVRDAFGCGRVRTPVQDLQFLINQLVEIAQRALSPGINDPSTAEACIDRLASALGTLAVGSCNLTTWPMSPVARACSSAAQTASSRC